MEGGVCTGGIDVKVFVVIAHDGRVLGYDVSQLQSVGRRYPYREGKLKSEES